MVRIHTEPKMKQNSPFWKKKKNHNLNSRPLGGDLNGLDPTPLLLNDSQEHQNLIVYPRRERNSEKT